jgi:hypothetical protein
LLHRHYPAPHYDDLSEAKPAVVLTIPFGLYRWRWASPPNANHFLCMPCSRPRWIGSLLSVDVGALARRFLPQPLWPSRTQRTVVLLELHWY